MQRVHRMSQLCHTPITRKPWNSHAPTQDKMPPGLVLDTDTELALHLPSIEASEKGWDWPDSQQLTDFLPPILMSRACGVAVLHMVVSIPSTACLSVVVTKGMHAHTHMEKATFHFPSCKPFH